MEALDNPLLVALASKDDAFPDFRAVRPEHILPAQAEAHRMLGAELEAIRREPKRTFASVVHRFDNALARGSIVGKALSWYLSGAVNKEWLATEKIYQERGTNFYADVFTDEKLFAAVDTVFQQREHLAEDERLLTEDLYYSFVDSGIELPAGQRARFRAIQLELAKYSSQFKKNVGTDQAAWSWNVQDVAELDGVPAVTLEALAALAEKHKETGYRVTLDPTTLMDILRYATKEATRRRVFEANFSVASHGDEQDNAPVAAEIARLRGEMAHLLGHDTYADWRLRDRMVGSLPRLRAFYDELVEAYLPHARREEADFVAFYRRTAGADAPYPIPAWNRTFYLQRFEKELHGFDPDVLREYFTVDRSLAVAFEVLERLYDIRFTPSTDVAPPHPDAQVFRIAEKDGTTLAYTIFDPYARLGEKRSGAWKATLRNGVAPDGSRRPPIFCVTMNVRKGVGSNPSLISLDDVTTIFHEFGHGMHDALSEARFAGQFGTAVAWDFVELPSQFLENFVWLPEVLEKLGRHVTTGAPLPATLVTSALAARNFGVASMTMGQVANGLVDLAWAVGDAPAPGESLAQFEERVLQRVRFVDGPRARVITPQFQHVFSGGYAAGYYSYLWSKAIEAHAISIFARAGFWDRGVANRFRRNILAVGGGREAMTAYVGFAGEEPTIAPMLQRDGLVP